MREIAINMKNPNFDFKYRTQKSDSSVSRARVGEIHTPHGVIETPNFIFCATKASLKGLFPGQIKEAGSQIILSNTYHLMLRPGADLIEKMGGLHKFMGWDGPMLTDSGGFQVFSLGNGSVASEIKGNRGDPNRPKTLSKITEEGAYFKSYVNGESVFLSPEKSIEVQTKLGADLILVLDECTPFNVDKTYTADSMRLSHRWARRSLAEFNRLSGGRQALYGIIQGGVYEDLRRESIDYVNNTDFFGHTIGGSLGATKQQMQDIVDLNTSYLRRDRPIHLLGIGGASDIFHGVLSGVDTFDCVHPTRLARHGGALIKGGNINSNGIWKEHINLLNGLHKDAEEAIEPNCPCYTCQNFSRSYLHNLFKTGELLAFSAVTLHNVAYMNRLMADIREAIKNNNLLATRKEWIGV